MPLPDNFVGAAGRRAIELKWLWASSGGGGSSGSGRITFGAWPNSAKAIAAALSTKFDPRDLKYCRNLCSCSWAEADDPFRWRDRLPLTRWGLAEVQLMGWPLLLTLFLVWQAWYLAVVPCALLCLIVSFFRDPRRVVPQEPGLYVSPADGKVVEITRLDRDEFIGGPAVRIGIFLSIFNVHLNRAPTAVRAIQLKYSPGEFLSATKAESALRNENSWIGLEEQSPPHRRMIVRQISRGAIARRIVCNVRPGEVLAQGLNFGMIKLGSRTELILPEDADFEIEVAVGDRVKAGVTVMARRTKL